MRPSAWPARPFNSAKPFATVTSSRESRSSTAMTSVVILPSSSCVSETREAIDMHALCPTEI